MKVLIFTFCSHQKLKYNYNKNTKVYVSKNEKKISNVKLKYLLTWQLQHFSSKNELNKTFFFCLSLCNMCHETGQYEV